MDLKIQKIKVRTRRRKLKAIWFLEPSKDLMAIHGLDAEKELIKFLNKQILEKVIFDAWWLNISEQRFLHYRLPLKYCLTFYDKMYNIVL